MYETLINKQQELIEELQNIMKHNDEFDLGHIQGEIASLAYVLSYIEENYKHKELL